MIFEMCAIAATLALIVLTIYLIVTLIHLKSTISQANKLMLKLEVESPSITKKVFALLESSNHITETLREYLKAFNPLLDSVESIGTAIQDTTDTILNENRNLETLKKQEWVRKAVEALELVALGVNVWQQIQRRRK